MKLYGPTMKPLTWRDLPALGASEGWVRGDIASGLPILRARPAPSLVSADPLYYPIGTPGAAAPTFTAIISSGALIPVSTSGYWAHALLRVDPQRVPADLAPTHFTWDAVSKSYRLAYQVADRPLPAASRVSVYWADGPSFSSAIGRAAYSRVIPRGAAIGERTLRVPATAFSPRPIGATHLVLVVDPLGSIAESDETNNDVAMEAFTDIRVLDATTKGLAKVDTITVTFAIDGSDVPSDFKFRPYLSEDPVWGPTDQLWDGERVVSEAKLKKVSGPDNPHEITLKISPVNLTRERPFIIVVADQGEQVEEVGEPRPGWGASGIRTGENNALWVIPLFSDNQKSGVRSDTGTFQVGLEETESSPAISGMISRGTADFDRLESSDVAWAGAGRSFKDEEPAQYAGDDHRVDPALLTPLRKLADLIGRARDEGRLKRDLWITDSFDEQREHTVGSRHYEGRAIDIGMSGGYHAPTGRRLSGLALVAGFAWVWNETVHSHVHVSHTGAAATVSVEAIKQAVEFAGASGLIRNPDDTALMLYWLSEVQRLTDLLAIGPPENGGQYFAERLVAVGKFKAAVIYGNLVAWLPSTRPQLVNNELQKAKIGELLLYNADKLRAQFVA